MEYENKGDMHKGYYVQTGPFSPPIFYQLVLSDEEITAHEKDIPSNFICGVSFFDMRNMLSSIDSNSGQWKSLGVSTYMPVETLRTQVHLYFQTISYHNELEYWEYIYVPELIGQQNCELENCHFAGILHKTKDLTETGFFDLHPEQYPTFDFHAEIYYGLPEDVEKRLPSRTKFDRLDFGGWQVLVCSQETGINEWVFTRNMTEYPELLKHQNYLVPNHALAFASEDVSTYIVRPEVVFHHRLLKVMLKCYPFQYVRESFFEHRVNMIPYMEWKKQIKDFESCESYFYSIQDLAMKIQHMKLLAIGNHRTILNDSEFSLVFQNEDRFIEVIYHSDWDPYPNSYLVFETDSILETNLSKWKQEDISIMNVEIFTLLFVSVIKNELELYVMKDGKATKIFTTQGD